MRKGEATKARILQEAGRLAAVRGLFNVSLNDVAETCGLSKSGLFKHFDSKEAMQETVLMDACDRFVAFVWEPLQALPPGRARLEAIFDRWLDWSEVENAAGGCLIMSSSVELDDQPGPLRDKLHERLQQWRRLITREFMALRDPPLDREAAQMAAFEMNSFILGHASAGRFMRDRNARASAREAFLRLLDRTQRGG